MRKLFYSAIVAVACFGFVSCGNSSANKSDQDSTATDSVADSVAQDTASADTALTRGDDATFGTKAAPSGKEVHKEGFGRCLESGCYCKEFKGRGETCRNCGHAYRRHY